MASVVVFAGGMVAGGIAVGIGALIAAFRAKPRHGDPCVPGSNCSQDMRCHPYANRFQLVITQDELQAKREKILGRREPDQ